MVYPCRGQVPYKKILGVIPGQKPSLVSRAKKIGKTKIAESFDDDCDAVEVSEIESSELKTVPMIHHMVNPLSHRSQNLLLPPTLRSHQIWEGGKVRREKEK